MHEEVKGAVSREITPTQRTEYRPRSVQGITKTRCELVGTIEGGGYEKTYEECRRVYGTDGETPSVVTKKGGYHEVKIAIRNANKKGYEDAEDGDFVNLQYASSSTRRGRVGHQVAQTICCTDERGVVVKDNGEEMTSNDDLSKLRIRKLTPRECWRLMDFDDDDFNKAQAIESNTQLYAQAGNSIVVNCLVAIFGQMFEGKENVYAERFSEPTP